MRETQGRRVQQWVCALKRPCDEKNLTRFVIKNKLLLNPQKDPVKHSLNWFHKSLY